MPGFTVPVDTGTIGSHGIKVNSVARYYYNYTWQIFQLFGGGVNDTALVHLKDTTLPTFTANQDSYISSSLEYKWAKSVTWDDIKVSWYDTVGLGSVMKKWRASVWSPTNGLQVASEYKKRSQIDVYLPTGNNVITWCLVGSWPKVIRQGELTYTDSNVKTIEVTITYDWANDNIAEDSFYTKAGTPDIDKVKASCVSASSAGMPTVIVSPSERN